MKCIIPAKASSTRVPDKNFRPFANGCSLLDIALSHAVTMVGPKDIFVSCEDESKRAVVEEWGATFLLREPRLCHNETPLPDFLRGIVQSVPDDDDVIWYQVIDPLFNQHHECLKCWKTVRNDHDSLVVVYPQKKYLLDASYSPLGFGFGAGHIPSQRLTVHYELPFTMSIFKRAAFLRCGYHVGEAPYWFHGRGTHIDIDTMEEFKLAGMLYDLRRREVDHPESARAPGVHRDIGLMDRPGDGSESLRVA